MKVKACVRSGECCKAQPCVFGEWNTEHSQCKHLVLDDSEQYSCAIHDEIVKDPSSYISPAFGKGCCRTLFNQAREHIIEVKYVGVEQFVEAEM